MCGSKLAGRELEYFNMDWGALNHYRQLDSTWIDKEANHWIGKPSWRSCHKKRKEHGRAIVDSLFQLSMLVGWAKCISTCGPITMAYEPQIWVYKLDAGS